MNDANRRIRLPIWSIMLDVVGALLIALGVYTMVGGEELLASGFTEIRPYGIPLIIAGVLLMLPLVVILIRHVTSSD